MGCRSTTPPSVHDWLPLTSVSASRGDSFYLLTGATSSAPDSRSISRRRCPIRCNHASTDGQLKAELGFLEFTVSDSSSVTQPDNGHGSFFNGNFKLDLVDPGTGTKQDGHLTIAEMQSAKIEDVLKSRLDLDANVQLHLAADVSSFPAFQADFEFVYQFDTGASPAQNGVQRLGFNNVRVNVGDFITSQIRPILDRIHSVLGPIVPIAERRQKPIPVLADLLNRPTYSLLDLARDSGHVERARKRSSTRSSASRVCKRTSRPC